MSKVADMDRISKSSATQARRNACSPLSYTEALRAVHRPRTDEENAFLHAEIARRYALQKKRRRQRADPIRFMVVNRMDDLEHLFLDRYGLYLPDDDAGWEDLNIVAHYFAHLRLSAAKIIARIVDWAAIWAPSYPTDKVTKCAEEAVAKPRKWKANTLAWKLGLTMEQRTRLKIKTIGAINVKPKDRPTYLREHHRQRKEDDRRANGVRPREAYLAGSISAVEPWVALGMSRATWYRKGKPMPYHITDETGPADYKGISSAALVSLSPDTTGSATAEGLHQVEIPLQQHGPPKQKRLGNGEVAARALSPSRPVENIMDTDEAPDLLEWAIAVQSDKWRQAMPGIRRAMAEVEQEALVGVMTLPEMLHVQAELMTLRQGIAGMEAAL
jgi:hypothetical protein